MLFKNITLIDENLTAVHNKYVAISGDKIAYIGDAAPTDIDYGSVYDGKNKILMSGLYNAHGHTPMTLLRGYAENLNLQDWLYNYIFPFEAKITDEDSYYATLLGIAEMMRTGTVSVTDMYGHMEANAEAFLQSGFKANMSNGLMAFDDTPFLQNPNHLEEERCVQMYTKTNNGRIKIEKSCHAVYTSNLDTVRALAEFSKANKRSVHIHLSETKTEVDQCIEKYGVTPVRYFYDAGLFDSPVTAAHCVWLTDEDITLLAEKKVFPVHNPMSNLKLASGISPIHKMSKAGIKVTLGTDGCSSNNNLDMFEEMKLCAVLNKGVYLDPTLTPTKEVLKFATKNGAESQGRLDCGVLKVGNKADLIVIKADCPSMQPEYDAVNNIVYAACGKDTLLTMIDGKIVYENGEFKTIDIEKVIAMVNASKRRILGE